MLRQAVHEFELSTRNRGLYKFTDKVEDWLARAARKWGAYTARAAYFTSLLIQENADPDVRRDLEAFFARLVPDGDPLFVHTAEGEDDMPAHVRSALTSVNLSIPLAMAGWRWEPGGDLPLGASPRPHTRTVAAHFIGN